MPKVMLGMSGGVDSSAAAKILLDKGYDVTGVTIKMFSPGDIIGNEKDMKTAKGDTEDAIAVASKLGIEHMVLDFSDEFRKYVMNDFIQCYLDGKTPNPCIECNKHIKFGKMLEIAEEMGFDYIATGHYAFNEYDEEKKRYILRRPADRSKDQTYVLYNLTQYQLSKIIFPLSTYEKSKVRAQAQLAGLENADKPDSQDICFVPDGSYGEFINKNCSETIEEGNFTDTCGNILGRHKGIIHYTVGQRKGLGIALGKPAFVISKDAGSNTVVLGDNDMLFSSELIASDVNFISSDFPSEPMKVTAKARYNQKDEPAVIYPLSDGRVRVVFESPQRAVTPGQSVVFYDGDIVVGGGKIV